MVPGRLGLLITLLLVLFNLSSQVSTTIPRFVAVNVHLYSCLLLFLHCNAALDHIFDLYLSQSDVPQVGENLPSHSLDLVERHLCRSRPRRVLCHSLNHQVQGKKGE